MSTNKTLLWLLLSCFTFINKAVAQRSFGSNSTKSCGTDVLMNEFLKNNAAANNLNKQIELQLQQFRKLNQKPSSPLATVVLPVVVHIIHNNGPENISDARVLAGIQHLNEAFKNSGYYDPATGVNTNIQFCLVKRDPAGIGTTGITRDVSSITNMNGPAYYSDDQNVKNINRWNPLCYINIWLVNSIPGSVAGYAYLPAAHGSNVDGILMEAAFFGASNSDDVVVIHEMGHYLGLYHTFEQGCTNNDCTTDGDKVCDTPPDNSTAYTSCGVTINSCSTDALSGFTKDMDDLTTDYMDYGNWDCMSVFTQGQADRMNWFIQNVRSSLLGCNSCQVPCNSPVQANFTSTATYGIPGTTIGFTNTSVNGASYSWYINDSLISNSLNHNAVFTKTGVYIIRLIATSSNPALCVPDEEMDTVVISSPVKSSFSPGYNGVANIGQNVSFTNTSTGAITYEWYKDNVLISTTQDYSTIFSTAGLHYIKLKAYSGICVDSVSVYYVINAGVSAGMSYRKNYEIINGYADKFNSKFSLILPDQNIISIGGLNDFLSPVTSTIAKLTPAGEVIWAKSFKMPNPYPGTGKASLDKAIFTKDGGILLFGRIDENGTNGLLLVKTDINGNIIWNKFVTEGNYDVKGVDIVKLPDGSFIAAGRFYYGKLSLYKFDANGSLIWSKIMTYSIECYTYDLLTVGNDVYFSGFIELVSNNADKYGILIMKIDQSDGTVIFGKKYTYKQGLLRGGKLKHIDNKLICRVEMKSSPSLFFSSPTLLTTDMQGDNSHLKLFDSSDRYAYGTYDLFIDAKKNTLFSIAEYSTGKSHLIMLDTGLSLVSGKTFTFNGDPFPRGITQFSNGDYLFSNSYATDNNGNIAFRLRPDLSVAPCQVENFTTGSRDDTCTVADITDLLIYLDGYRSKESTLDLLVEDRQILVTPECLVINPPPCDTATCKEYRLEAPLQICKLQDTVVINLRKSAGCNLTTEWSIGGALNYQSLAQSDSVIKLSVTSSAPGSLLIKARSMSSCKVFEDSITIDFNSSPDKIDLGQDIQLCNASTIQLHAGPGFKGYQWQDGSADSTFTAYLPGTYYVTASDFCGGLYSDTMIISVAPAVPFDLGPDRVLCMNDTLSLTAPGGFAGYKWSPDYNINTPYGPAVRLFPIKDTVYTVTATKAFGCTVLDSIRIKVTPVDAIQLGNDTALCAGGFVNLNAGSNFSSNLWNTGAGTPSLRVTIAGVYHVLATDSNGCKARDTLQVTAVYPLPVVNLGADRNICSGDSIVLLAGNGFQRYLWQDNSPNATFTVRNTGQYWVTITNSQGCAGADTIAIMNVMANPVINLGADTSFCDGEHILLTPGAGFASYSWQDNSTAATFTASQPGIYSVTVKDASSCIAADSLRVISLYPKPILHMGNDTTFCRGQSIVLNAGNGFLTYLWNTNDATQSLTVSDEGAYWVKVSDAAGCYNTDSIHIAITDTPKQFIAEVYNICETRPAFIKPLAEFSSYTWFNGSTADSILITQPGNYWLAVTDRRGCAATERFTVEVINCVNAVYFPNAFSPNDDGVNESFRPFVSGLVKEYYLSIYNRFGEKLFESNDYARGWTGWFKQKKQNPGTYVWMCTYKLDNGFASKQKGTVVLVR